VNQLIPPKVEPLDEGDESEPEKEKIDAEPEPEPDVEVEDPRDGKIDELFEELENVLFIYNKNKYIIFLL
jgi:hypothetical protein